MVRGYTRGYSSRGGNSSTRGTYRPSNNYTNNRMQSTGRTNDRYGSSSGRYNFSHNNGSNRYDSRRDRFNTSSTSRHDTGAKRSYTRDTSRDRSSDHKRSRTDDYRRTSSSTGRGNRTPPPPPSPAVTSNSSSSGYRGVNTSRHTGRDDSKPRHHRSDMGPPSKRPPLRSTFTPRIRGTPSRVGIRPGRGAATRIVRRESNDLRIMRRKLMYAQQKDRARVLKIARLTSSLRRRRFDRHSSTSPLRSRSGKKGDTTSEDEDNDDDGDSDGNKKRALERDTDDDDENNDDEDKDGSEEKSEKRSKVKRAKSSDKSNADEDDDDEEADEDKNAFTSKQEADQDDDDDDISASKKAEKKSQSCEGKDHVDGDEAADQGNESDAAADEKGENDESAEKADKKEGKKKEVTVKKSKPSTSTTTTIATKKTASSTVRKDDKFKDDKERKFKKNARSDDEDDSKIRKSRITRRESPIRRPNYRSIKLTCIHCHMKCVTFSDYFYHLSSRPHKAALRQIAMRQRAHLLRLRARQRAAQKEIEEKSKETYESKFCHLCRLHYRQPKAKHQLSEHHKIMKKFLMPYCSTCYLAFKSPILYETHRCSLEHIRNKARKQDSDSDNSGDEEMREIDLNKFMTVDSVGEIDEEMDADVEALLNDSHLRDDSEDDADGKDRAPVGGEFVKEVNALYCEICDHFASAETATLEAFKKKHCMQRSHLKAFLRHKEEEKNAKKRKEAKEKKKSEADTKAENEEEDAKKSDNEDGSANNENDNAEHENDENDPDHEDDVHADEKLWEDVDKDLGDLLRHVDPEERDDDEENDSILNIDIESEKHKNKEVNGKKDDDLDSMNDSVLGIDKSASGNGAAEEEKKQSIEKTSQSAAAATSSIPKGAKPQRILKISGANKANAAKEAASAEAEAKE